MRLIAQPELHQDANATAVDAREGRRAAKHLQDARVVERGWQQLRADLRRAGGDRAAGVAVRPQFPDVDGVVCRNRQEPGRDAAAGQLDVAAGQLKVVQLKSRAPAGNHESI